MKPIVHSVGRVVMRMRPRNIVNSQLNSFTPVGIEISIVVMIPKNALTFAPEPIVKKWCSQTKNDSTPIDRRRPHHRLVAEQRLRPRTWR